MPCETMNGLVWSVGGNTRYIRVEAERQPHPLCSPQQTAPGRATQNSKKRQARKNLRIAAHTSPRALVLGRPGKPNSYHGGSDTSFGGGWDRMGLGTGTGRWLFLGILGGGGGGGGRWSRCR